MRVCLCSQHGRGSSGVPKGAVPGPLLPAVGLGKPSEGLMRPPSQMSSGMSQLIGLKEKGLPHIARLLQSGNSDVVRSGASLLSNMSRHPALHRVMGECPWGSGHPLLEDPHSPGPAGKSPSDLSLGAHPGEGAGPGEAWA